VDVDHLQTDRTTLSALKKIVLFLEAPTFKIVVESMHEIGCDRRTPPFGSCPEKERNRVAATDVIQVVRWESVQVHDIGGRIEPWGQIGVVSPPDWTIVDPDNIPCEAAFLESHLAGLTAHASNDWWS